MPIHVQRPAAPPDPIITNTHLPSERPQNEVPRWFTVGSTIAGIALAGWALFVSYQAIDVTRELAKESKTDSTLADLVGKVVATNEELKNISAKSLDIAEETNEISRRIAHQSAIYSASTYPNIQPVDSKYQISEHRGTQTAYFQLYFINNGSREATNISLTTEIIRSIPYQGVDSVLTNVYQMKSLKSHEKDYKRGYLPLTTNSFLYSIKVIINYKDAITSIPFKDSFYFVPDFRDTTLNLTYSTDEIRNTERYIKEIKKSYRK